MRGRASRFRVEAFSLRRLLLLLRFQPLEPRRSFRFRLSLPLSLGHSSQRVKAQSPSRPQPCPARRHGEEEEERIPSRERRLRWPRPSAQDTTWRYHEAAKAAVWQMGGRRGVHSEMTSSNHYYRRVAGWSKVGRGRAKPIYGSEVLGGQIMRSLRHITHHSRNLQHIRECVPKHNKTFT